MGSSIYYCPNPKCPPNTQLILNKRESLLTEKIYYCPECTRRFPDKALLAQFKDVAPVVIATGASTGLVVIGYKIMKKVWTFVSGDPTDLID